MTELYRDTLENAQGRAEYWKASSLDATREIELLQGDLKRLEAALDTAMATLDQIASTPRNRGARRHAKATLAVLRTQLDGRHHWREQDGK